MSERLRPRDLAYLAQESAETPMHNVTVEVFDPGDPPLDHDRLLELIRDRISFVPRYRQRLRGVPGRLGTPVWVDDPHFDLHYHVRRSALPRPGSQEQLQELVARIASRRLDRDRPLWEIYFVEGLEGGRVALLAKSHQLLVDGTETVDLGQVLLDLQPEGTVLVEPDAQEQWQPAVPAGHVGLLTDTLREAVAHPTSVGDTVVANTQAALRTAGSGLQRVRTVANALANRRPGPETPINGELCQQRRFVGVRTDLEDYRRIRAVHGGTVNDVVLATITGAMRAWLMSRTESLGGMRTLRAMVPMSVIDDELQATSLGTQVAGHLVNLPIGEPSPVVRLAQVAYAFQMHSDAGRAVRAKRMAGIAGFAPTTFHALGARVAAESAQPYHLTVTNVPGPQFPLYAHAARMEQTYPVPPLTPGHALAIGVTSYDGGVFYGITADRDMLPDVDTLEQCLLESLEELRDSASESRPRAPRGRGAKGRASTGQSGSGTSKTGKSGTSTSKTSKTGSGTSKTGKTGTSSTSKGSGRS